MMCSLEKNETTDMKDFVDRFKEIMKKKGAKGLQEELNSDIQAWTNTKVNIAVTGNSNTGKSTFINTILEFDPDDEIAAESGIFNPTLAVKQYIGKIRNAAFWDLPGVGTKHFPKDTYADVMNLQKYDYIIILAKTRFTENDLWLSRFVKEKGIKFCFVRTHLDNDIENDRSSHPRTHSEQAVIASIRQNCIKNLEEVGPIDVFLIDSGELNKYDFNDLVKKLLRDFKGMKAKILAMSLVSATEEIIEEKARYLRLRAFTISIDVAIRNKKESSEYDVSEIFRNESNFYKTVFGINDETLRKDRDLYKLSQLSADLKLHELDEIGKQFIQTSQETTAIFRRHFEDIETIMGLPGFMFCFLLLGMFLEMIARYQKFANDIFQNIPIDFTEKCIAFDQDQST